MARLGRLPIDGELLARQINLPPNHRIHAMGTDEQIGHFLLINGDTMPEVPDGTIPPVTLLNTGFLTPEESMQVFQNRQTQRDERDKAAPLVFGDLVRSGLPPGV